MGRKANDVTLHRLANDLRDVEWAKDHEHLIDEAEEVLHNGELRNVSLMKDGKTFAVRTYCCGARPIIGYTKDIVAACRFADMARMRFWVYRTRDCREPVRSDLNFPPESAKADLKNELQALQLLDEIQKHFIDSKQIDAEGARVDTRRTARDEFLTHFTELKEAIDILNRRVDHLNTSITAALELFKHLRIPDEHVDTVDAEIIYCEGAEQHMTTGKKVEFTRASFDQAHGLTPIGAIEEIFDPTPTQPNTNQ